MIKEFIPLAKVDISIFEEFNNQLKIILEKLDDNTIFDKNFFTEESFKKLIHSFVESQRASLGRTKPGSWSLVPDDEGMDSDNRVDFIFMPTYLVTAILSRTLCDYPLLVETIPNYKEVLKKGMLFCSYRDLYGHGFERDVVAAEVLTILSLGKVPYLLEKNKELCPELYQSIKRVSNEMKRKIRANNAIGMWGENLQDDFSSALETLYIKNDIELYETIKTTDMNCELLSEKDLLW